MTANDKQMLEWWYGKGSPHVPVRMVVARRGFPASTRRGDYVRQRFPGQFHADGLPSTSSVCVMYVVERRTSAVLYLRLPG